MDGEQARNGEEHQDRRRLKKKKNHPNKKRTKSTLRRWMHSISNPLLPPFYNPIKKQQYQQQKTGSERGYPSCRGEQRSDAKGTGGQRWTVGGEGSTRVTPNRWCRVSHAGGNKKLTSRNSSHGCLAILFCYVFFMYTHFVVHSRAGPASCCCLLACAESGGFRAAEPTTTALPRCEFRRNE